jgi:anti-anti-sigma regulatory factor
MDLSDFENIRSTISMAKVMGVSTVVCGMRPGVVASIVLLGADTEDIRAARDLDMAFELLNVRGEDEKARKRGGDATITSNNHS